MTAISVEALIFSFDHGWIATKYDIWNFYVKKLQSVRSGVKAVDIMALSPHGVLFLIEVKDYRMHSRTKPSEISQELSNKVLDSLAALLPAKLNATDTGEANFATIALTAGSLKVVLHLEQPAKHSKLFPRAIDPSNVQTQLRQALRAIDPHTKVTECSRADMGWNVA